MSHAGIGHASIGHAASDGEEGRTMQQKPAETLETGAKQRTLCFVELMMVGPLGAGLLAWSSLKSELVSLAQSASWHKGASQSVAQMRQELKEQSKLTAVLQESIKGDPEASASTSTESCLPSAGGPLPAKGSCRDPGIQRACGNPILSTSAAGISSGGTGSTGDDKVQPLPSGLRRRPRPRRQGHMRRTSMEEHRSKDKDGLLQLQQLEGQSSCYNVESLRAHLDPAPSVNEPIEPMLRDTLMQVLQQHREALEAGQKVVFTYTEALLGPLLILLEPVPSPSTLCPRASVPTRICKGSTSDVQGTLTRCKRSKNIPELQVNFAPSSGPSGRALLNRALRRISRLLPGCTWTVDHEHSQVQVHLSDTRKFAEFFAQKWM